MPDSNIDPLTRVHNALWEALEAHSGFTGIVKVANRIKFAGADLKQRKDVAAAGDLPEIRIVPAGGMAHLFATSSSSTLSQNWMIEVSTDQLRLDAPNGARSVGIFPIKWEIYRAMSKVYAKLNALTFNGESFVKKAPLLQHMDAPKATEEEARNVTGWYATLSIMVEMHFGTAALQA